MGRKEDGRLTLVTTVGGLPTNGAGGPVGSGLVARDAGASRADVRRTAPNRSCRWGKRNHHGSLASVCVEEPNLRGMELGFGHEC